MVTIDENRKGQPLVVIVGATGTGKSKLAVDLASKFRGEIINADAVQMYRGLPIVTNKIPENERNGIPHHLLGQIGLDEQPWTVLEFVEESSNIINQIRGRGKLPIVVGGTNYYIFSLLFKDSTLSASHESNNKSGHELEETGNSNFAVLDGTNAEIYAKLQQVDPEMAQRWHPEDRRKIQRSLEIYLRSGRKPSEIYAEQAAEKARIEHPTEGLRYNPLIFWLHAEDSVLKQRLDHRVDLMIQQGLLDEVKTMREFERHSRAQGHHLDDSKGIWVAIGYKELSKWLDASETTTDFAVGKQEYLEALRREGIASVASATRQYAKRQARWVRLRLAQALHQVSSLNRLLLIDGTDLERWTETVSRPSESAVSAFLEDSFEDPSISILAKQAIERGRIDVQKSTRKAHICETCQKTLMSEQEWIRHMKSNSHKRVLRAIQKREQHEAYIANFVAEQ